MMEQALSSKKPSKDLIQNISNEMNIDPAFIEKDWYAVQLISLIAEQNKQYLFQAIFSGGTSLSKAHRIIKRFSEDLDFVISIPNNTAASHNQRKKFRENIVRQLKRFQSYFQIETTDVECANDSKFFRVPITYPKLFKNPSLRPTLQLEMTFLEPRIKPTLLPIRSIIADISGKPPETEITCISPLETAGDKISAFSWRLLMRDRDAPKDDPTFIRHLHDIAALEKIITSNLNEFIFIAKSSLETDKQRRANKAIAHLASSEILLQVSRKLENDPQYEDEYEAFVMNMSYAKDLEKIHFKEACAAFNHIIGQMTFL